jgi:hypothetical protein
LCLLGCLLSLCLCCCMSVEVSSIAQFHTPQFLDIFLLTSLFPFSLSSCEIQYFLLAPVNGQTLSFLGTLHIVPALDRHFWSRAIFFLSVCIFESLLVLQLWSYRFCR